MTKFTKEQLIQLGDLMSAAVNSDNPAVKSMIDQLLTTVALTEDMQEIRARNPIIALSNELKRTREELAKLKTKTGRDSSFKLDEIKKLVNSSYTWSYDDDDWKKDRW